MSENHQSIITDIASYCTKYGYDATMNVLHIDDECEQELELETELLQEMDTERPV